MKNCVLCCFFLSFLASCGDTTAKTPIYTPEKQAEDGVNEQKISREESVWICYNPSSEFHGKICSESAEECLVPGDRGKFCWILDPEECFSGDPLPNNELCPRLQEQFADQTSE